MDHVQTPAAAPFFLWAGGSSLAAAKSPTERQDQQAAKKTRDFIDIAFAIIVLKRAKQFYYVVSIVKQILSRMVQMFFEAFGLKEEKI